MRSSRHFKSAHWNKRPIFLTRVRKNRQCLIIFSVPVCLSKPSNLNLISCSSIIPWLIRHDRTCKPSLHPFVRNVNVSATSGSTWSCCTESNTVALLLLHLLLLSFNQPSESFWLLVCNMDTELRYLEHIPPLSVQNLGVPQPLHTKCYPLGS